jgi:2-methylcitrate dehydratase PrpD
MPRISDSRLARSAAIGLVRGKGGLQEFTAEAVADPSISRVRDVIQATADDAVTEDQVAIDVEMDDGRHHKLFVEESLGNIRRPLSNAQLEEKFLDQAINAVTEDSARALIEQCWALESVAGVAALVDATVPAADRR